LRKVDPERPFGPIFEQSLVQMARTASYFQQLGAAETSASQAFEELPLGLFKPEQAIAHPIQARKA
jgi:hypothetical protein